jgi:hypothetical protein
MNNYAIITGIDYYQNEKWRLDSAVKDALRFASWAIRSGEVKPENIRLLLSSTTLPEPEPVVAIPNTLFSLPVIKATSENLVKSLVIREMQKTGWGKDGDRLYFYYAGHGCSHPEATYNKDEPVLIFADVCDLPDDYARLLKFSEILGPLRSCGPSEQFFFLDACQDFALEGIVAIGGVGEGRFVRPLTTPKGEAMAKQYVIYATSPGEKAAVTKGKGVFGAALLRALRGDPRAPKRTAGALIYELRFSHLVEFVQMEVQRAIAGIKDASKLIQVPGQVADMTAPNPLLLGFPQDQIEEVDLFVSVLPESALEAGTLTVFYENRPELKPLGPPLHGANRFRLRPAYYTVEAIAPAFQRQRTPPFYHPGQPLEVTLLPLLDHAGPAVQFPFIRFQINDDLAVLEITGPDGDHTMVQGNVSLHKPRKGIYLVRVKTPEGRQAEQAFEYPYASGVIELQPPANQIGPTQSAHLRAAGIEPSLAFGANAKPASLLGFAAFATYTKGSDWGASLRTFGLEPIAAEQRDDAWLCVLLSVEMAAPAIAAFISASTVALSSKDYKPGRFRPLPGYPAAAQYLVNVGPGNRTVEVRLPQIPPTRFPLTCFPGRVATLCLNVAAEGNMDVQMYLIPFDGQQMDGRTLRVLEQAQRFYSGSEQLPDTITNQQLLTLKSLDPLLGCLAGYTLIRNGNASQFLGTPRRGLMPGEWNEESPMQNMLVNFPLLPDSHVLAGLCETGRQEEHFAAALEQGIPLFTEGFRVLIDHYPPHSTKMTSGLWHARRTLAAGSAFSTWLGYEPALAVEQGSFVEPPFVWSVLDKHRLRINQQLQAVGALLLDSPQGKTFKTGFLVAPGLVLTVNHAFQGLLDKSTDPPTLLPGVTVSFVLSDGVEDAGPIHAVHSLVKIDDLARLALLRLETPVTGVDPLRIAPRDAKPEPDQRLYLIGYPFLQTDIDEALVSHVFGATIGRKRVQPGYLVSKGRGAPSFDHDAFTLGGSGGSPVIDMATGLTLGVHWGSMDQANFRRGRAVALWKERNRSFFRSTGLILD